MNKWCGKIGFVASQEIEPGMWVDEGIDERKYFGGVSSKRWTRQTTSEKRTITDIEAQYPSIILSIGGVYNA